MITSDIRVSCLNFQFWCTHKCLRVHQKCEETSSAVGGSQSVLVILNLPHFIPLLSSFILLVVMFTPQLSLGLQKLITDLDMRNGYKGGV